MRDNGYLDIIYRYLGTIHWNVQSLHTFKIKDGITETINRILDNEYWIPDTEMLDKKKIEIESHEGACFNHRTVPLRQQNRIACKACNERKKGVRIDKRGRGGEQRLGTARGRSK